MKQIWRVIHKVKLLKKENKIAKIQNEKAKQNFIKVSLTFQANLDYRREKNSFSHSFYNQTNFEIIRELLISDWKVNDAKDVNH